MADPLGHGTVTGPLLTEVVFSTRAGKYHSLFLAKEYLHAWLLEGHELFLATRSKSHSKHMILPIVLSLMEYNHTSHSYFKC